MAQYSHAIISSCYAIIIYFLHNLHKTSISLIAPSSRQTNDNYSICMSLLLVTSEIVAPVSCPKKVDIHIDPRTKRSGIRKRVTQLNLSDGFGLIQLPQLFILISIFATITFSLLLCKSVTNVSLRF